MHPLEADRAYYQQRRIAAANMVNDASSVFVEQSALREYSICISDELRTLNSMLDDWEMPSDRWKELNNLRGWLLDQQQACADRLISPYPPQGALQDDTHPTQ